VAVSVVMFSPIVSPLPRAGTIVDGSKVVHAARYCQLPTLTPFHTTRELYFECDWKRNNFDVLWGTLTFCVD
jgi:hypothetical protein